MFNNTYRLTIYLKHVYKTLKYRHLGLLELCQILSITTILCGISGCATITAPTNIIDLTDEQWLEDPHGNHCKESEMLIYPDRIEYYYGLDCPVRRVVKVKPHLIPKPQRKAN